jgi:hypothetical protein
MSEPPNPLGPGASRFVELDREYDRLDDRIDGLRETIRRAPDASTVRRAEATIERLESRQLAIAEKLGELSGPKPAFHCERCGKPVFIDAYSNGSARACRICQRDLNG